MTKTGSVSGSTLPLTCKSIGCGYVGSDVDFMNDEGKVTKFCRWCRDAFIKRVKAENQAKYEATKSEWRTCPECKQERLGASFFRKNGFEVRRCAECDRDFVAIQRSKRDHAFELTTKELTRLLFALKTKAMKSTGAVSKKTWARFFAIRRELERRKDKEGDKCGQQT